MSELPPPVPEIKKPFASEAMETPRFGGIKVRLGSLALKLSDTIHGSATIRAEQLNGVQDKVGTAIVDPTKAIVGKKIEHVSDLAYGIPEIAVERIDQVNDSLLKIGTLKEKAKFKVGEFITEKKDEGKTAIAGLGRFIALTKIAWREETLYGREGTSSDELLGIPVGVIADRRTKHGLLAKHRMKQGFGRMDVQQKVRPGQARPILIEKIPAEHDIPQNKPNQGQVHENDRGPELSSGQQRKETRRHPVAPLTGRQKSQAMRRHRKQQQIRNLEFRKRNLEKLPGNGNDIALSDSEQREKGFIGVSTTGMALTPREKRAKGIPVEPDSIAGTMGRHADGRQYRRTVRKIADGRSKEAAILRGEDAFGKLRRGRIDRVHERLEKDRKRLKRHAKEPVVDNLGLDPDEDIAEVWDDAHREDAKFDADLARKKAAEKAARPRRVVKKLERHTAERKIDETGYTYVQDRSGKTHKIPIPARGSDPKNWQAYYKRIGDIKSQ